MKRPEGFDAPRQSRDTPRPAGRSSTPSSSKQSHATRKPRSQPVASNLVKTETNGASSTVRRAAPPKSPKSTKAVPAQAVVSPREERRNLRKAARDRRAVERGEVKRFTRYARTRRAVWASVIGVSISLTALLAVAVFSPILSLREISVEGADRVDATEVRAAVAGQLGSPLALLDFERIERELAEFPLIRSYVTQTVPPSTLVIQIVEREPLGVIATDEGFDVVDAAGIVLESLDSAPEGLPLIRLDSAAIDADLFEAVSEVLLALPASLAAEVNSIGATTRNDVTFTLRGVGQSVVWGSAENSAFKSRVLAAMIAESNSEIKYEFDVSAPESVVVTRK